MASCTDKRLVTANPAASDRLENLAIRTPCPAVVTWAARFNANKPIEKLKSSLSFFISKYFSPIEKWIGTVRWAATQYARELMRTVIA